MKHEGSGISGRSTGFMHKKKKLYNLSKGHLYT